MTIKVDLRAYDKFDREVAKLEDNDLEVVYVYFNRGELDIQINQKRFKKKIGNTSNFSFLIVDGGVE